MDTLLLALLRIINWLSCPFCFFFFYLCFLSQTLTIQTRVYHFHASQKLRYLFPVTHMGYVPRILISSTYNYKTNNYITTIIWYHLLTAVALHFMTLYMQFNCWFYVKRYHLLTDKWWIWTRIDFNSSITNPATNQVN